MPNGSTIPRRASPRTADGKPDFSGVYERDTRELSQDLSSGMDSKEFPIRPWAAALAKEREEGLARSDPYARCLPPVVPRIDWTPQPIKILQMPMLVVILYESTNMFRQIFLDGRALPDDPQPTWMGYSVGRWEGDTLVVESNGFRDEGWLDGGKGNPHTDAMRVTERFRRLDFGRLQIQATIDDPKAYTKPFTVTQGMHLLADTDLIENICNENEKDVQHLVGK